MYGTLSDEVNDVFVVVSVVSSDKGLLQPP